MIVSMNKNPDKYVEIFAEAYKFLEKHNLVDGTKDTFNSLAEYYGHMADFFDKQNYKYVMLPLDEDPFAIDLNTRTINVPASFSKCASVQSDQLAETIVFVADRYFDYMDLANTNIYVQWTIPADAKAGRPNAIEGATRVEMVDLDTYPGQIRFAWPLNDAITQYAGNIKFAVRFFRLDNANQVIYSLNTLEATLTIKPALQPNLNENSSVESPVNESAFRKAIVNSIFTNQGVNGPDQPTYSDPGSNIVVLEKDSNNEWVVKGINDVNGLRVANLNTNNTLTLGVQAIVTDAGVLTYDWYYISNATGAVTKLTGNEQAYVPCVPQPTAINPETKLPYGRQGSTRYFTKQTSGTVGYEPFNGNDFVSGVTYYELFDIYTIPADSAEDPVAVTGQYYVDAWNEIPLQPAIDGKTSIKVINPTRSDDCLLPGPMNVEFVANGDLAAGAILQDGSKMLSVEVKADTYGAIPTYTWLKSTVEGDNKSYTVIAGESDDTYFAVAPGWYKVKVESVVNREKKEATSAVCKVTNAPLPAVLKSLANDKVIDLNREDAVFAVSLADDTDFSELKTEGYQGIWQIKPADATSFTTIPENYQGVTFKTTVFENDTIEVTNKIKASSAVLRCLVSNTLNGQKAIFDHSGQGGVDANLGIFENAAPYTYAADADDFFFVIQKI